MNEPSLIEVDSERARYWLSVGAQPTEPVAAILKLHGFALAIGAGPGCRIEITAPEADHA